MFEIVDNPSGCWFTCRIVDTQTGATLGEYVSHFHARQCLAEMIEQVNWERYEAASVYGDFTI